MYGWPPIFDVIVKADWSNFNEEREKKGIIKEIRVFFSFCKIFRNIDLIDPIEIIYALFFFWHLTCRTQTTATIKKQTTRLNLIESENPKCSLIWHNKVEERKHVVGKWAKVENYYALHHELSFFFLFVWNIFWVKMFFGRFFLILQWKIVNA